jgi:hypothetical protein
MVSCSLATAAIFGWVQSRLKKTTRSIRGCWTPSAAHRSRILKRRAPRPVFSVAIAKQMLYVHLHRMFGTGEGDVVRLPRPDNASPGDAIDERMRLYSKETGAVEVLGYNGTVSYLCASQDGRHVFFTDGVLGPEHDTKAYLVENNGKPREIKLKLPE